MAKETAAELKKRAGKISSALARLYPEAKISLDFSNPLELLVATILSAQCTDERVNKVTVDLFRKYRKAEDYANSPEGELEEDIRPAGFYRNKAKSIRACCRDISQKHGGKVPGKMEELTALAGVGRKTANVALGSAFGVPGIVTDTHVIRVSARLGLTSQKDPEKIERGLMEIIPQKTWTDFSTRMILFGRSVCQARKPKCGQCPIHDLCRWADKGKFVQEKAKGGARARDVV